MTDVITMQVIQNSLVSIANEMGIGMMRSAYSTIFNEVHDFSCAILDRDGYLAAEGLHLIQHMGGMEHTTLGVLKYLKDEGIEINPGDVIFHNHPYIAGTHLPEINIFAPVFYKDELILIPAIRAHHQDVGGSMLGSTDMHATEIYQEGLIIPPVKVYDRGELRKDVFNMIVACSRIGDQFRGDLNAQVAGCRLGQRRITQLLDRYGLDTFKDAMRMLSDYSERLMRGAIEEIPDGVYEADNYCDDDGVEGKVVRMCVKITVKGSDITVDFTGTDPQTRGPLNIPWSGLCSGVYAGIFFMTLSDIKSNTGCYRPIKIIAPEGTFVNPRPPAPVIMMNDIYQRIYDVIVRALAPARPEKAYAGSIGGTMTCFVGGNHPKTGKYYIAPLYYSRIGGWGAHYCKDGKNTTTGPVGGSAIRNVPMEVLEQRYPLRVLQYSMRQGSGGPGKFRGGLGGIFEMTPLGHDITSTQQFESVRCPPRGIFGGMAGRPSAAVINPGKGDERILPPMISGIKIKSGQSYKLSYSGGSGWGDPFERDPEMVLDDVRKEFVSLEAALEDYGVVIKPEAMEVDYEATERVRKDPSSRKPPPPWPIMDLRSS